jgi:hypothetical protein
MRGRAWNLACVYLVLLSDLAEPNFRSQGFSEAEVERIGAIREEYRKRKDKIS